MTDVLENDVPTTEPPATAADSASSGESESVDASSSAPADALAELDVLKAEAVEWRDKYLRKLAEFDNYRKRMRQESELLRQLHIESIIGSLLPVLDDFDRMMSTHQNPDDPFHKGVELIRGKLAAFLDTFGVQKIDCLGKPFNPTEHDALMLRPTPDFPPETVMEVIVPGYRMGDRVIRHAQVVVSAPIESSEIDSESP